MLESSNTEEIIFGDQCAIYEGMDEDGNMIMHLEDGSYKMMLTEKVYNEMSKDHSNNKISELLGFSYSDQDGKLYVKVKWHTGDESLIDAQTLKEDEPLQLANFIMEHPIEQLCNGCWNNWVQKMQKNINIVLHQLQNMNDVNIKKLITDILPFWKARRVCQRAHKDKIQIQEGSSKKCQGSTRT